METIGLLLLPFQVSLVKVVLLLMEGVSPMAKMKQAQDSGLLSVKADSLRKARMEMFGLLLLQKVVLLILDMVWPMAKMV
jgi:hypothetical protein